MVLKISEFKVQWILNTTPFLKPLGLWAANHGLQHKHLG